MKLKINPTLQTPIEKFKSQKRSKQIFLVGKKTKKIPAQNYKGRFFIFKSDDVNYKSCSIKSIYEQQKLKETNNIVNSKKSKKKKIWNIVFFLCNMAVIAIILISQLKSDEGVSDISELFSSETNWWYILAAFGCFLGFMLVESLKVYNLIYRTTKRRRHFLSYKVSAIGRYYDDITPLASGGQPFQIFYLNKRGIRGDMATSIPLVKYMFWQIVYVLFSLIILITKANIVVENNAVVVSLAWLTLGINLLLFSTVLLLSVSKKIGPRIVIFFFKILNKMKLIKNYQSQFRKVMRFVNDYQKTMRYFVSNFWILIIQLALALANILIQFTLPYFIYMALVPNATILWSEIIVKMTIIDLVTGLTPLPGGTGAAEFSFAALFSSLFGSKFFWAMLIWRFFSYFIYLIQGLIVLAYDFFYGNKKAERLEKNGYWTAGFVIRKRFRKKRN